MTYIPMEPIESSNIKSMGYDRRTETLRIAFIGRHEDQEPRVYDYPMVPEREYQKMMKAESKGKFLNTYIKPVYGFSSVNPNQLVAPKEPCCDHPDKSCSEECGHQCDPGCCPQAAIRQAKVVAGAMEHGHQLINKARGGDQDSNPVEKEEIDGD